MKDAITRFSENDMELDGRIDGEDDENTSDGEGGRVVEEMVCTTHPHSLLFLYIYIYIYIFPSRAPPLGGWVQAKTCAPGMLKASYGMVPGVLGPR